VRISQRDAAEGYYHDYRIVEVGKPEKVLEGLRLVFVELPKSTGLPLERVAEL
jgi:hypothetical protein